MGAFGRWVRALGYYVTFRFDKAAEVLEQHPGVVKSMYERIIREKRDRIQQFMDAVAVLMGLQENKKSQLQTLTEEVKKYENLKAGAAAMAKQLVAKLRQQGKSEEQIKQDTEYQKCLAGYNDFSTTLAAKQETITGLESDIERYTKEIDQHKLTLIQLKRDVEGLKKEQADTVAEVISSQQETQLNSVLAGISNDRTGEELERLRNMRHQMRAKAALSRTAAGTETAVQEAEFLKYARESAANSEFESLVGMARQTEEAPKEPPASEKLPEK